MKYLYQKKEVAVTLRAFLSHRPIMFYCGTLFVIGASFFIAGSFSSVSDIELFSQKESNLLFFMGSIFFTLAAYTQLLASMNPTLALDREPIYITLRHEDFRFFSPRWRNPGFIAGFAQLVGTILFNFNTFDAIYFNKSVLEYDIAIWTPDMIGSIAFMISALKYLHESIIELPSIWRIVPGWITLINLAGSIFFQISAILAFMSSVNMPQWMVYGSNLGTFLGAICFFMASFLMIPYVQRHIRVKYR